jgi:NAD(P)-dependent dehydrogenase (short-subunit alcohol dehydrogenase family)
MENKVVLITGGSSGIGKTTGVFLYSKGMKVYGTTRNLKNYPDFEAFTLLELDVKKPETITGAINHILSREGRLDVLINNAGVGITGPIEETPIEEINKTFDTNLNGPIRMMQAVLPQMRKQGSGLIINVTSIAGYMGLPFRGVYSATKASLEVVTETLRMETRAFGIKITNLAPGDFATNIASGRYHAPVVKDSPYQAYGKTLASINEDVEAAQDPILVAEKVYAIIRAKNPKGHYLVGTLMQKLSVFLKRILPDKVFEKLLLNHYKL